MKRILIIISNILIIHLAFAQNLVQDGGFDSPNFCPEFDCDIFGCCGPWTTVGGIGNSPAILFSTAGTPNIDGIPNNHWCPDGNCILDGYSVQWNIPSGSGRYLLMTLGDYGTNHCRISNQLSSTLVCGNTYQIEFDVSRHDFYHGGTIQLVARFGTTDSWTGGDHTDDLEPKIDISSDETGGINNDEWRHVTFQYTVTACGGYNYFLLSTETPFTTIATKAVYIDNVSVTEVLNSTNCSSTKGCVDFTLISPHSSAYPLQITGLKNITQAKLEIQNSDHQIIRTIGPVVNPPNSMCWDGKDDNGADVGPAAYFITITLDNDCNTDWHNTYSFQKLDETTPYFSCTCNSSVSKPPQPCCSSTYTLSNVTLIDDPTISGSTLYSYNGNLTIGDGVNIPATVCGSTNMIDFQVDNYMDFDGQFNNINIETGALVNIDLIACRISHPSQDNSNDDANSSQDFTQIFKNNLKIYPNPASKSVTIETGMSGSFHLQITNVYSNQLMNSNIDGSLAQINISILSSGIYFVEVKDAKGISIGYGKLIVQ
ncbi:MAG: T9SS type A sorting domain-containing protein [Chitinophagales bacterium]